MPFDPGTYIIKLQDDVPALFVIDGNELVPIGDPTFETSGTASFTFAIDETQAAVPPLVFDDPPLTWRDTSGGIISAPAGNGFTLEGETILVLNVSAPEASETVHFRLQFNHGSIGAEDISRADPTIVEKPPEIAHDGQ